MKKKSKFNDLTIEHLSDKEMFEKVASGKEFAIYKNITNNEYELYDISLDEAFSIGNDHEFLEVYHLLKKAVQLEDMEIKNERLT